MRTLIVDDDIDQRETVRTILEQGGIGPVFEAADGPSGLVAAAEHQPDLVILDIAMPGPSGLDILPELVEIVPTHARRGAVELPAAAPR